jgi:hypothetical protein
MQPFYVVGGTLVVRINAVARINGPANTTGLTIAAETNARPMAVGHGLAHAGAATLVAAVQWVPSSKRMPGLRKRTREMERCVPMRSAAEYTSQRIPSGTVVPIPPG